MTPANIRTSAQTPTAPPLAWIIPSQLLLTEKSSGTMAVHFLAERIDTVAIRATRVTVMMEEFEGYSHFGLND